MIRIAVCDDRKENLEELCGYIEEFQEERKPGTCEVCGFLSGRALLQAAQKRPFEIYFLDVLMPEMNGMDIGREIRKRDQGAVIIYVTVSREYAFEAFGVRAYQYLEKPVDQERLFETLERVMPAVEKQNNGRICVRTRNGLVNIDIRDIVYVENVSRCAVYVLKDGSRVSSVCCREAFEKSIHNLNEHPDFVQPHKSYFVNMHYIRTFKLKSLEMEDETEVLISRKRLADTKRTYLNFLLGEEGEVS